MKRFGAATLALVALIALPACWASQPPQPSNAAVNRALSEFSSEYGPTAHHSTPARVRDGSFRISVQGQFTVHGPRSLRQHADYVSHYRSGWIEFDLQGELLEVNLGSD
jgi:hypothetical protein